MEPVFLNDPSPKVEVYKQKIYIKMKGYDFPVLQSYQGWVARTVRRVGINAADSYGSSMKSL